MPGMDEEELFRAMKSIRPDVRALLVSGYADHKSIERMFQRGLRA